MPQPGRARRPAGGPVASVRGRPPRRGAAAGQALRTIAGPASLRSSRPVKRLLSNREGHSVSLRQSRNPFCPRISARETVIAGARRHTESVNARRPWRRNLVCQRIPVNRYWRVKYDCLIRIDAGQWCCPAREVPPTAGFATAGPAARAGRPAAAAGRPDRAAPSRLEARHRDRYRTAPPARGPAR